MSFQLSAPLNTAAIAIKRISSRTCSRFRSTRGSRNSAKYFRGLYISPSPTKTQPLPIAIYMRRPCGHQPAVLSGRGLSRAEGLDQGEPGGEEDVGGDGTQVLAETSAGTDRSAGLLP